MNQKKEIAQMLSAVMDNNYAAAKRHLAAVVSEKLTKRVAKANAAEDAKDKKLNEARFDEIEYEPEGKFGSYESDFDFDEPSIENDLKNNEIHHKENEKHEDIIRNRLRELHKAVENARNSISGQKDKDVVKTALKKYLEPVGLWTIETNDLFDTLFDKTMKTPAGRDGRLHASDVGYDIIWDIENHYLDSLGASRNEFGGYTY